MFKRIISLMVTVVLGIVGMSTYACAEGASTYDLYTSSASSTLTISGTVTTCISKATGYSGTTTKIVINQYLQKKTSAFAWSNVKSWSETDTGFKGSATNYAYLLPSGTYRLKTVFTVYAGTKYETITKYSSEKTI